MINGSTSLINTLKIFKNGKVVYEGNNLFFSTHVKSLVEYSGDYARSIASSEFFHIDSSNVASKENFGYGERLNAAIDNKEVSCIIPLNRYSFFKRLETNMLPPSQIIIEVSLTNDDILIYKSKYTEKARVVVTKFNLWIPRMIFNSAGLSYVMKNYMVPTNWTYLHETTYLLNKINHTDNNFRITPSAINPKYVFVFFQRTTKIGSQNENPYLFDTFKLNAADDNCHLQSARLTVGNGIYYPKNEFTYDNIVRIFKAVNNYVYKQNDKNTGSFVKS